MPYRRPLPAYLAKRYQGWKATTFEQNKSWYQHLVEDGQHPRAMVISCCDSRVDALAMFEADSGEFFIHRNVANLVPPYDPSSGYHGTSSAIEYAVTALKVPHLIVMGHSQCGGVAGCYEMCSGNAPELEQETSFVGRWIEILRPGYERLPKGTDDERKTALEKEAVLVSLENLMTFPFVKDAVEAGRLTLHGLWNDIATGTLEEFDIENGYQAI